MLSRAIFRVDIGFYMGVLLWPLVKYLHRIHVLFGLAMILTKAHMTPYSNYGVAPIIQVPVLT